MRPYRNAGMLHAAAAVALAVALAGCNGAADGLPREPVSGSVTFEGQPLRSGSIQLLPAAGGVSSGGIITDGRFTVPRDDGPVPGKYAVSIVAAGGPKTAAKADDSSPGAPGALTRGAGMIPLRYNFQTELTAEVKAGGPNVFDFALTK